MAFFTIFISIFYVVGFGVLGYGIWTARQSTLAAAWPTSAGTITSTALDVDSDGEGTSYEVKAEYKYFVAGKEYGGNRIAFGYSASTGREAHVEIYNKLKTAAAVDVRYDPTDPERSTLSFGINRSIWLLIVFGAMWLAFTFGFTLLWWLEWGGDDVLLRNLTVR
jgi:hypothetical protein